MKQSRVSQWLLRRPSTLSHHGAACCSMARSWLLALDRSMRLPDDCLPSWISDFYEWGPSRWPLHWCEAAHAEKLDCGGLSALARHLLHAREAAILSCQLIRQFDDATVAHWIETWKQAGLVPDWIHAELIYHETCAILREGRVELWDPSSNTLLEPITLPHYGRIVAIRLEAYGDSTVGMINVDYGKLRIRLGSWNSLDFSLIESPVGLASLEAEDG